MSQMIMRQFFHQMDSQSFLLLKEMVIKKYIYLILQAKLLEIFLETLEMIGTQDLIQITTKLFFNLIETVTGKYML